MPVSSASCVTPGVYLLLCRLPRTLQVTRGRRAWTLRPGWYGYIGRALNGLEGRLARHLQVHTGTAPHWHVDHLLAHARVRDIQVQCSREAAAECALAATVKSWPQATPVPGFGAGDCSCGSHLVRFARRPGWALTAAAVLPHLEALYARLADAYVDHACFERDPFETLVSCVLSLRTQDPVTHAAAQRLLKRLRTPAEFAAADPVVIAELIYPVGMYRQKARCLVDIGRQLVDRFGGRPPATIEALLTLPGVGRKTANLVRSFAFHEAALCVDTHVHRIANRWGLVRTATADSTEEILRQLLPEAFWSRTNALLVQHGQQVCRPLRPACRDCFLQRWCGYEALRAERGILERIPAPPPHPSLRFPAPVSGGRRPKVQSPFE